MVCRRQCSFEERCQCHMLLQAIQHIIKRGTIDTFIRWRQRSKRDEFLLFTVYIPEKFLRQIYADLCLLRPPLIEWSRCDTFLLFREIKKTRLHILSKLHKLRAYHPNRINLFDEMLKPQLHKLRNIRVRGIAFAHIGHETKQDVLMYLLWMQQVLDKMTAHQPLEQHKRVDKLFMTVIRVNHIEHIKRAIHGEICVMKRRITQPRHVQ
mmetsp:Transcript_55110/g.91494  ORF Transcript_55110/g.91494 Transcript_55110/m.91494 type:complete len:209 (+) Transcript_55110:293-919(+)